MILIRLPRCTEKMKQKAGKLSAVANYKFTSSAEKSNFLVGLFLFQVGKFRKWGIE